MKYHRNILIVNLIYLVTYIAAQIQSAEEYDYIIVGGGTAGCVVASRLSEDDDVSVLVIESGYDPINESFIPIPRMAYTAFSDREAYDWRYYTEPQKATNEKMPFLSAKLLGGGSSFNGMIFTRCSPFDYDYWKELGNDGWDYENVLPYFKKIETMLDPDLVNNEYHGSDGPVKISTPESEPIVEEFFKAAGEIGIGTTDDFNGAEMSGKIGHVQTAVNEAGKRMSTLEAYLRPAMARTNLNVLTESTVTKIKLKRTENVVKAKGVYFTKGKKIHYIKAAKEIIVSAGALNSPKILMLSGVGPKEHLEDIGIEEVFANLPVGKNLQNHWQVQVPLQVSENTPVEIRKITTFEALFEYVTTGKGLWANPGFDALIFYDAPNQPKSHKFPYMEQMLFPMPLDFPGEFKQLRDSIRKNRTIIPELVKKLQNSEIGYELLLVAVKHNHPRHRGEVKLRSANPSDVPKITLEYFNEEDISDVVQGIRLLLSLLNTKALKRAGVTLANPSDPRCSEYEFDTDEYWKCYVNLWFDATCHQSCTCKMAPDSTGVVDNRLRVKGIDRLRVIDSAIIPVAPSGHTMAPTIMIAEKGAHMIKQDNMQYCIKKQNIKDCN